MYHYNAAQLLGEKRNVLQEKLRYYRNNLSYCWCAAEDSTHWDTISDDTTTQKTQTYHLLNI